MPTVEDETSRLLDVIRKASESIEQRGDAERNASNIIGESSRKMSESLNEVMEAFKKLKTVVDETIVKFNVMKSSVELDMALRNRELPGLPDHNLMTLKQNVTFTQEEMDAQNAHGVESI